MSLWPLADQLPLFPPPGTPAGCRFCGEDIEVDLLLGGLHRFSELDWQPCCEEARACVSLEGWEAFGGGSLEATVEACTGHRLQGYDPEANVPSFKLRREAPGTGVSGWQNEVFADIDRHHRHHPPPQGWKFGVAVYNGPTRVGVAVVGRPVSRQLAKARPRTLEVTRVCTWGPAVVRRNAASMLYGAAAREARKLGADELITYTLAAEGGTSLRAAGFTAEARTRGGSWSRRSRPRVDMAPTAPKVRWGRRL